VRVGGGGGGREEPNDVGCGGGGNAEQLEVAQREGRGDHGDGGLH